MTNSGSKSGASTCADMLQEWTPTRMQRIPTSLQAVFLRSNRGEDVHKAPPQRMAHRTFFQNFFFRRATSVSENKKKMYDGSKDKLLNKGSEMNAQYKRDAASQKAFEAPEAAQPVPKASPKVDVEYTLQEYFEALLKERGYAVKFYNTLETAYYNHATQLQIASYGPRMVRIVKEGNAAALRETLAVGLSPNPCNQFGESLLHMVCRRGDIKLLEVMIEAGSSLQVSDDYGRTPLHDAFWAANPAYGVVETILKSDSSLFFMRDKRGALPLSYVTKANWSDWMKWLDENIDIFFREEDAKSYQPTDLALMKPNSFSLPEPKTDLSMELIKMVACGDLSPHEARIMSDAAREGDDPTVAGTLEDEDLTSLYDSDEDLDDDDSDYDSECDSDEYDSECEDEDYLDAGMEGGELVEMLQMARLARAAH